MVSRIILLQFFCFSCYSFAQDQEESKQIWLKGVLVDSTSNYPIPNAYIVSFEKVKMYSTDSLGRFQLLINSTDSLKVMALGFEPTIIKMNPFFHPDSVYKFKINQKTHMLRSIDVNEYADFHKYRDMNLVKNDGKLHLKLPPDLANNKKNTTPPPLRSSNFSSKPPILVAAVSPLSYIHYYTSKSERIKRKALVELRKSEEREVTYNLMNKEIIQEISGFSGDKLTDFIIYCNVHIKLKPTDNTIIVKQRIKNAMKEFEQSNAKKK